MRLWSKVRPWLPMLGLVLVGVLFIVTGQWRLFQRLWMNAQSKKLGVEIEAIKAKVAVNDAKLGVETEARKDIDAHLGRLCLKRDQIRADVADMSTADIAKKLLGKGF